MRRRLQIRGVGYIKLWRALLDSPIWPELVKGDRVGVFVTLLLAANWKDQQEFVNGKVITVPRGSFLSSQREIAEYLNVPRQRIRSTIDLLEIDPGNGPFLTQKSTHGQTLFTICNYELYQSDESEARPGLHPDFHPGSHPASNPTLYNKIKEDKEGNQKSKTTPSKAKKKPPKKENKQAIEVLQAYHSSYQRRFGKKPYIDWKGKDRAIAVKLIENEDAEEIKALAAKYPLLDDDFCAEQGHPFALFPSKINKIRAGVVFRRNTIGSTLRDDGTY